MTERAVILGAALVLVACALTAMAAAHQAHYRHRRMLLLEGRVATLERIIVGEHK